MHHHDEEAMLLIQMNNHATWLIQFGHYTEAYYQLRRTMELEEMNGRSFGSDYCGHRVEVLVRVGRATLSSVAHTVDGTMFSSPLVITFDTTTPTRKDISYPMGIRTNDSANLQRQHTVCATALYNMGLACHLRLQRHSLSSSQQRHLQRTVQVFYQQALDICQTLPLSILQLAICNNLLQLTMVEQEDWDVGCFWYNIFCRLLDQGDLTFATMTGSSEGLWKHFLQVKAYYSTTNPYAAGAA